MHIGIGLSRTLVMVSALGFTAPLAHAKAYLITYSGTIISGNDGWEHFGPLNSQPDRDLSGSPFSVAYTLTIPTVGARSDSDGSSSHYYGGSVYAAASPVSALVSVNGFKKAISGSYLGGFFQNYSSSMSSFTSAVLDYIELSPGAYRSVGTSQYVQFSSNSPIVFPLDLSTGLDLDLSSHPWVTANSGNFQDILVNAEAGEVVRATYLEFLAHRVTIGPAETAGAVPEPSTWSMMILGLGLMGGVMRRRRVRTMIVRYS
jgi:PEP-CTERM motif